MKRAFWRFMRFGFARTVRARRGISLLEIIIATTIIVIITAVGIAISNPAGQLASSRNTERQLHLQALMNAIRQNIADSVGGTFTCASGSLPTSSKKMAVGAGNYNIGPCLVPNYLTTLPFDPSASGAHYVSVTDYDTGYNIVQATSTNVITLTAPSAELKKTISVTR